ncbi:basic proline-rich protein-like [Ovis canadensis]|uniref:basic proline-rich protein-like n=1 Tax=Ovis canadensis TaxID=37174 RepID=UPI003750E535
MPAGTDPLRGDAYIYQIKTNPGQPPPGPGRGAGAGGLVTLDNLGPIARPPWRRRPIRTSALSTFDGSRRAYHGDHGASPSGNHPRAARDGEGGGWGRGDASGECPAAPPRARRRRRRLRRVSLSARALPRHVPRGGPEGSAWVPRGVWGLPRAPPPPGPPPVALATTASPPTPRPADPRGAGPPVASRGLLTRRAAASPSAGPCCDRLPRRRPWASLPRPVVVGRSSRRPGPVAGRQAPPPAPPGRGGLCPRPAPTPTPPGRLCVSVRVLPSSRLPPARWAPSFPSEPLPAARRPQWWWRGRGARERGRR